MDTFFGLIGAIFPIIWFFIVISIIVSVISKAKNAAGQKGKGFDAETIRKRLEELRKTIEAEAQKQQSQTQETGKQEGRLVPDKPGSLGDGSLTTASKQAPAPQPVTRKVIRSRFEDYTGQLQTPQEGAGGFEGEGAAGLEGVSTEGADSWKSQELPQIGSMTPFQKEVAHGSIAWTSQEGTCEEDHSATVKGVDTFQAWAEEPIETMEGDIEAQLSYMAKSGEPEHVDLVGGINMKEMADAIVWAEIMTKPLSKRPHRGFRARRAY